MSGHHEIYLGKCANAGNKGAYVNKLDYVVLAALEIDTKFNVNESTGSDGILRGSTRRTSLQIIVSP